MTEQLTIHTEYQDNLTDESQKEFYFVESKTIKRHRYHIENETIVKHKETNKVYGFRWLEAMGKHGEVEDDYVLSVGDYRNGDSYQVRELLPVFEETRYTTFRDGE